MHGQLFLVFTWFFLCDFILSIFNAGKTMLIVSTYHKNFIVLFWGVFYVTHLALFNNVETSLPSAVTSENTFAQSFTYL